MKWLIEKAIDAVMFFSVDMEKTMFFLRVIKKIFTGF